MSDQSNPAKRPDRQSLGGPLVRRRDRWQEAFLKDLHRRFSGESRASSPSEEGTDPDETVPQTEASRQLRCRAQAALLQDLRQILSGEGRAVSVTAAAEGKPREWSVTLELSLPWHSLSPAGREAVRAYERQQRPGGGEPRGLSDNRQSTRRRG